ncbi:MAG: DUF1015 domain-containing protein [Treponema sp.]|jgi:hypothetical protein|nr:DUF1015 domain-containing protein [Treponema sp.]
MEDIFQRLAALGAGIPELLLPRPGIDLDKWAVIACDQFTQDGLYWDRVRRFVGTAPSALNLIFPEIYLGGGDREERAGNIHRAMETYLREGVFAPPHRGFIYTERRTSLRPLRRGLVFTIDLEQYDWAPHARPLIRSTEGTVPERLPPRMEIRRRAPLEIPHILLLIDEEEDRLLPGLAARAKGRLPLYDTSLMLDAGGVRGWLLDQEEDWTCLADGLENLARKAETRYGQRDDTPFLYAVGDGNHSLATAKAVWEEYKAAHGGAGGVDHPARWALVEVENLYDPGIVFEPIHRVLFGPPAGEVLEALSALPGFSRRSVGDRAELVRLVGDPAAPAARLGLFAGSEPFLIESGAPGLITDSLQPLLDRFIADHGGAYGIDYIHGEDELFRLAGNPEHPAVGLLLPPIKKSGLFQTVARRGPLPRKSFSMGEAAEKRFYLECRRLFG